MRSLIRTNRGCPATLRFGQRVGEIGEPPLYAPSRKHASIPRAVAASVVAVFGRLLVGLSGAICRVEFAKGFRGRGAGHVRKAGAHAVDAG